MTLVKHPLVVITISTLNIGGAQVYVNYLSRLLLSNNYRVILLAGSSGDCLKFLDSNIEVFIFPCLSSLRLLPFLRSFFPLMRFLRTAKPHLIVANSSVAGIVSRLCSSLLSLKILFVVHGFSFLSFREFFPRSFAFILEYFTSLLTNSYYLFISSSDFSISRFLPIPPSHKFIIPNSPLPPLRLDESLSDSRVYELFTSWKSSFDSLGLPVYLFSTIARHTKQKDYKLLFQVFSRLCLRSDSICLFICIRRWSII